MNPGGGKPKDAPGVSSSRAPRRRGRFSRRLRSFLLRLPRAPHTCRNRRIAATPGNSRATRKPSCNTVHSGSTTTANQATVASASYARLHTHPEERCLDTNFCTDCECLTSHATPQGMYHGGTPFRHLGSLQRALTLSPTSKCERASDATPQP